MEESTPHCKLARIKALTDSGKIRATRLANEGATALGYDFNAMLAIVKSLSSADFYKSMTTRTDHRIWQDVYRPMTSAGQIYLKLTVIDDVLIVSFKEM